jgi:hypothetical protein
VSVIRVFFDREPPFPSSQIPLKFRQVSYLPNSILVRARLCP